MWSTLGLAFAALVLLMNSTKTGLVPDEDQGTIMVNVTTAPGTSLAETHMVMEQVADRIQAIPQIRDFMQVAGYGMIAGQGSPTVCVSSSSRTGKSDRTRRMR